MKKLTIMSNGALPSDSDIRDFEDLNDILLPEGLKRFFKEQNPMKVKEKYIMVGGDEYAIHGFHPFDSTNNQSFQHSYKKLNDIFENKYVAFAYDSGGWKFVVSLQSYDYGKVYFCRMDEDVEDAMTLLADSLEAFMDELVPDN